MTNFVHLHVHSEFSVLDGCGKQNDFVAKAVELGCPAVCFTEHGTLRGIHELHENAKAGGIKPIYGIEFYSAKNHKTRGLPQNEIELIQFAHSGKGKQKKEIKKREEELGIKKRYHITVLAKDNVGLKNLYKLSSIAWTDGFYSRPRIDLGLLEQHGEGLIVLSGCLDGYVNQALLAGDEEKALDRVEWFSDRWGKDFYLEIMPNSLAKQQTVNLALTKMARSLDVKLVATADVHYILKSDWQAHDVLLCVNTRKKLSDPDRWSFDVKDFWYQTREEMVEGFRKYHSSIPEHEMQKALDNTVEIAEKCVADLKVDKFRALVPSPTIPKEHDDNKFRWLVDLCMKGWEQRDIEQRGNLVEYEERLQLELKQIKRQKVEGYFLVIWDLCQWAKEQGINRGPGRGSVGGSLVAYLAGIIDVDPVKHGLIFERFMNPGRIDIPDIDLDFEDKRRHEIVDYLIEQYGQDRVARISTVSRMTGKMCFRDLARVLDVPFGEMGKVVDLIVPRSSGDERASNTIEDVIDQTDCGQEFDKKYPDVLKYAKRLEGQTRGLGLHAAGVIVSSDKLTDWIPLETRDHNGKRVVCTGVDMVGAEAQGLLKIDILGLRTLSVIGDCIKLIEARHDKKIDLNCIDLEDKNVLDNFTAHQFAGVFQFDTPLVSKMCKGIVFERFDDIPVMIALGRPGTLRSGLASEYLQRKINPSERVSIHPTIDKICKDTFGVVVFQEQVIKIFTEVAGFSPGVADELRKLIGKRVGEERLRKEKGGFVDGAVANGFPKRLAEEIFDKITFFGEYAFNLAHSTAYGLIGYRQMWLKTYYPLEFMWALLANEPDRRRVIHLIRETKKLGVEVLPVDVNESKETFSISNDGIRTGLVELKGVGKFAVLSIVHNQPFRSFVDFIERVNLRAVHKGVIEVLAKSGALEKLVPNLKWFLENLKMIWTKRSKQNWSTENLEMIWTKRSGQDWNEWITEELEKSKAEPDYNEDEKEIIATEISPMSFGKHPIQPHLEFLNSLSVDWFLLDNELFEKKWGWVRGFILDTKYKKSEKSGSYVSLNIEDEQGNSKLFKLNSDVLSSAKETVDSGVGTPVVALVTVYKKFKQLRIRALYDANELYNGNIDSLGKALVKPNDFFLECKKNDLARKIKRSKIKTSGVALVVAIDKILDKNEREMAFVSLYSKGGMIDVIAFASTWEYTKDRMKVGELIDVKVSISSGSNILESVKKFD